MKNKLKIFVVLIFFSLSIFSFKEVYADSSLRLQNLDFDITVNEDASIDVIENWEIEIRDTNTLFKNFILDSTKFSYIDEVSVKDVNRNLEFIPINEYMYSVTKDCFYALNIEDNKFEIAWGIGMDDSSGTEKYQIRYKVYDAIAVYNDCAELYWQLMGNDNGIPIDKISGTIHLPGNIKKDEIRVWGHTNVLNGIINANDDATINFYAENIPENNMVEVRSAFPTEVISLSNRTYNYDKLDEIIAEETEWANEANNKRQRSIIVGYIVVAIVAIVGGVCAVFQILIPINIIRNAKNKIVPTLDVDYYRELPRDDATPAEAATLLNKPINQAQFNFSNVFSATLMDLNLKKILLFEVEKETDSKENINIILNDEKFDINSLKDDEKAIYTFLKNIFEKKKTNKISIKVIQDYIQNNSSKIASLISKVVKIETKFVNNNDYTDKLEVKKFNKLTLSQLFTIMIEVFAFSFIAASGYLAINNLLKVPFIILGAMAILGIILAFVAKKKLNIYTQKAVDEIDKWKGLKDFMEDFSLIDQKELPSIVIWEKYLVYATAFGIADKVIKQLKIVYPELNEDTYFNTYGHSTVLYLAMSSNFRNDFSSAISSSISTAMSSGSGAGGGFSGGGGGGGGGGGAGGR